MEKIYEKLKAMTDKQFLTIQWIFGSLAGIICWLALRISGMAAEDITTIVFLAIFLVFMLGSRAIARKIERPLTKFSIAMAIALGICIVIFVLFAFVISDRGLIELVFNIPI